jgi:hypothetical protein
MNHSSPLRVVKFFFTALSVCLLFSLVAQGRVDGVASYATLGNPTTAIATLDGKYVLVSVTNVGGQNFTGADSIANGRHDVVSGPQIFRNADGVLKPYRFLPLGTPSANGLIVVAHPDDDYYFAATVYRMAVQLHGQVDELIITNGEGGFRYSILAERITTSL